MTAIIMVGAARKNCKPIFTSLLSEVLGIRPNLRRGVQPHPTSHPAGELDLAAIEERKAIF